jgi:large exoprotein involved in heme utilization and adhesion
LSGTNGKVSLTSVAQGWDLNADSLQSYGDISLTNRSSLEASGAGNTAIQLLGKNIQLRSGSIALMVTQGFQPPGSFQIKASEALQLSGVDQSGKFGSFLISDVFAGTGAAIDIAAPQIALSSTAMIHSRAFGKSQGGNMAINASTIQIDGQADFNPAIRTRLASSVLGQSNAGTLNISTDQLNIISGGMISASNLGTGRGGDIAVVANTVKIDGFTPLSRLPSLLTVVSLGQGNAGNLSLHTQALSVTHGGSVTTSTLAGGNAGGLEINASRSITVSGSLPSLSGAIEASEITSGATIVAREVQQRLGLPPIPSGEAGSVTINTPLLSILDGEKVRVDNEGLGNAGTLRVNANAIYLKGGTIEAATAVGEGGNLSLQAQTLLLRDRSSITATAGGLGKGGNITIQSPIIVGLENSDIIANAVKGKGGSIQISTQSVFGLRYRDRLTVNNDITASSEFGVNGTVQVNTIGVNPSSSLVELPVNPIDSSQKIATSCTAKSDSSFVATGRGGVPENPMQVVTIDRTWSDLRAITETKPRSTTVAVAAAIEATTLQANSQGQMELIARSTAPNLTMATCAKPR